MKKINQKAANARLLKEERRRYALAGQIVFIAASGGQVKRAVFKKTGQNQIYIRDEPLFNGLADLIEQMSGPKPRLPEAEPTRFKRPSLLKGVVQMGAINASSCAGCFTNDGPPWLRINTEDLYRFPVWGSGFASELARSVGVDPDSQFWEAFVRKNYEQVEETLFANWNEIDRCYYRLKADGVIEELNAPSYHRISQPALVSERSVEQLWNASELEVETDPWPVRLR